MPRLLPFLSSFAIFFAALILGSCVAAQAINETATIASIEATTQECDRVRQVCNTINAGNVKSQGKELLDGLFSILWAVHQSAVGLEQAGAGYFEDPAPVVQAFAKLGDAMGTLTEALSAKSTVLISGGLKKDLYSDLISLEAVFDAQADELARRSSGQFILEFYKVKDSIESFLENCIAVFD